ncbi:hypothetical protein HMPREF9599_01751 [Cutibacterium acnes HL050PA2]|nr:hypothetical protein HMPREF9599_01751 [Cutibacterium acnes HL050PA2]
MKCDGRDIDPPDDRKRYSIDDNSWKFWFCFVVEAAKVARGPLRNPFTTAGPRSADRFRQRPIMALGSVP